MVGPSEKKAGSERLILPHGGYRKLKSFQLAQLCYDVTVRFCDRYVSQRSRTFDQMVQAARSGVQNIAEGSKASGTSKTTEIRLTNVARASLEELRLDYEDYLRQRDMAQWSHEDLRCRDLVARRCSTVEDVALWIQEIHDREPREIPQKVSSYAEIAANAALVLIGVSCVLLGRQVEALAATFEEEGGFRERMYRVRSEQRKQKH